MKYFLNLKNLSTRNKLGRIAKTLTIDNGRVSINNEMDSYIKGLGIKHHLTVLRSPQQNGVLERKNRNLVKMTRCLLAEANVAYEFW